MHSLAKEFHEIGTIKEAPRSGKPITAANDENKIRTSKRPA